MRPEGFYWVRFLTDPPTIMRYVNHTWAACGTTVLGGGDSSTIVVLAGPLKLPDESAPDELAAARKLVGALRKMGRMGPDGPCVAYDGRITTTCEAFEAILDHLGAPK